MGDYLKLFAAALKESGFDDKLREHVKKTQPAWYASLERAEQKLADYEAVLRWYADPESYWDGSMNDPPYPGDLGDRARDVLAKYSK